MIKNLHYIVLAILTIFLAGCGYDTVLQYKTEASTSYRLKITSETPHQASSVIKQMFMEEGFNHNSSSHYGHLEGSSDYNHVESYAFYHSSGNITIQLLHHEDYKRAIVAIYPARLNSVSSKRRAQLKEHEEAILRIKSKLVQTNSFAEYIPTAAQGKNGGK